MKPISRLLPVLALIAYGVVLVKVLVLKQVPAIHLGVVTLDFSGTDGGHPANFIPFKTIGPYLLGSNGLVIATTNLIGNIILLIPIGALLPLAISRTRWRATAASAICIGLLVETTQALLRVGIFDIDDVILNAVGVLIGYTTFVWFKRWISAGKYTHIILVTGTTFATAAAGVYIVYPKDRELVPPDVIANVHNNQTLTTDRVEETAPTKGDPCGGTGGTGQIVGLGHNELSLQRNDGVVQVLDLTSRTSVRTPTGKATQTDLKVGDRVTVVVLDRSTASAVLVCSAKADYQTAER